jgi:predicted phosphodiesterase
VTRVAVLADIHCNVAALDAVLADATRAGAEAVWTAGDVFGYLPQAASTYRLLRTAGPDAAVLGNHDLWTLHPDLAPAGIGDGARANAVTLDEWCPEALDWLTTVPQVLWRDRDGWRVMMCHGTPDDPLHGRYYPDDQTAYRWLPGPGEILILGQTHWPLCRGTAETGLLLNPGSVGQPRDGNPAPSWALLDTAAGTAELRRARVPAAA